MQISLQSNIDQVRRRLTRVQRQVIPQAAARALNRVARQAHTQMAREVAGSYAIKVGDAKKAIRVTRTAGRHSLTAVLTAAGSRLPLMQFRARQTRRGVTVMVRRGERKLVRGAFVATMKSGHTGVFARGRYGPGGFQPAKPRLPITELTTLSVPGALGQREIQQRIRQFIAKKFEERFAHEIRHALSRLPA